MNTEFYKNETEAVDVSILIVSYNTRALTRACIESIVKFTKGVRYEVIVVDNASADGSAGMIKVTLPFVRLFALDKNLGFAGGNNVGINEAKGRHVLLLNSDTYFEDDVVSRAVSYLDAHPRVGIIGAKLVGPDGKEQPSARRLPSILNKILNMSGLAAAFPKSKLFGRVDYSWWDHSHPKDVGWVVGAFFLISGELMDFIGNLDDRYFLYYEEIDYCLSAKKAGWQVLFYPFCRIVHLGGESSITSGETLSDTGRQMLSIRLTSEFRYYRKFYGWLGVTASAIVEWGWFGLTYIKHTLNKRSDSMVKRCAAKARMKLIMDTLVRDQWGSGLYHKVVD